MLTQIQCILCEQHKPNLHIYCMVLVTLLLSESPLHWFEVNSGVRKRGSDEDEGDFKLRKTMFES